MTARATGAEHDPVGRLDREELDPDPFGQFTRWYDLVRRSGTKEPTAMTLATASADGAPSARTVLLKAVDAAGFVFYTNYESRKGRELGENPRAALLFYWPYFDRQVVICGTVARERPEASDAYFATRPRDSQLGAWASDQSRAIAGREVLQQRLASLAQRFQGREVPRPPHWGGFRLTPSSFEFWQCGPARLHDRFRYVPSDGGAWKVERLAP